MMVFVVTHDDSRRDRLTTSLRERGYEVSVPSQSRDIAASIRETQPHVVVLDLYLSNPGPLTLLNQMREEGKRQKVVALGGQSIRATMGRALGLGVDQLVGEVHAVDGQLDTNHVESAIRACFAHQIKRRAQELWEQQGRPAGGDDAQWHQAEEEVLGLAPAPVRMPPSVTAGGMPST